jgi:(R,R)-butanediol dehydrogenase/meso-butanediol dehydrogenase/diacetyl reductase
VRALRYHGIRDLRLEEVPAPIAGPGELLIRVSVVGVCGTDAAEYVHGPHLSWPYDRPHPASGHQGPVIPGHELVGVVEAVGSEAAAAGFAPGDLVASGAGAWCGECAACRSGRTNGCARYWTVGLQRDGGLAEFVAVPAKTCVAVAPYGLTEDAAALSQPMAIAAHAVDRGAPRAGEDVLVVGAGGIGAFITWAASQAGGRVVATDPDPERRSLAARLGAAATAAPDEATDVTADLVLEVSGTAPGLATALRSVRPGGRVVLVGLHEPPSAVDLRAIALREVSLIGTVAHRCLTDLPAALALLAARTEGWSDIAPVAIPLESVVEDGLLPMAEGRATRIKTLVDPRTTATRPTRMNGATAAPPAARP